MLVKRFENSFYTYLLDEDNCVKLLKEDGTEVTCFYALRMIKDDITGELRPLQSQNRLVIPIDTLLSDFVKVDSHMDKEITDLYNFKKTNMKYDLEKAIKPFVLNETVEVTNLDNDPPISNTTDGND